MATKLVWLLLNVFLYAGALKVNSCALLDNAFLDIGTVTKSPTALIQQMKIIVVSTNLYQIFHFYLTIILLRIIILSSAYHSPLLDLGLPKFPPYVFCKMIIVVKILNYHFLHVLF